MADTVRNFPANLLIIQESRIADYYTRRVILLIFRRRIRAIWRGLARCAAPDGGQMADGFPC